MQATLGRLAERERTLAAAAAAADLAREAERVGTAGREDAIRIAGNLAREMAESEAQLIRVTERLARAEQRLAEIDAALVEGDMSRSRLDQELGSGRSRLGELEAEQEAAREQRVHWQVQEAHVAGGLRSSEERLQRAAATREEAERAVQSLGGELTQLEADTAALAAQQAEWREARAERQVALHELEAASGDADSALAAAEAALMTAERGVAVARAALDAASEESHGLQVRLTETAGTRRSILERVEAEWRRPFEQLVEQAPLLDLDLETLESEAARVVGALEAIGPVNPLAVEEHAEEVKRLDFLTTQRDDLVGARQSLIQAIREIDGTARTMFLETFTAVQGNFSRVFQTLFGGGECELRLANPDDPLESEIDIHAAPRGKRTQRIHLLSSGRAHPGGGEPAVQHLSHEAEPLLPHGRSGRAAGRRQRRPVHPAARRVQGRHPVPGDHPQSADDAGRGRGVRRDDAGAGGLDHRRASGWVRRSTSRRRGWAWCGACSGSSNASAAVIPSARRGALLATSGPSFRRTPEC